MYRGPQLLVVPIGGTILLAVEKAATTAINAARIASMSAW
jgi:hypothetical protein